MPQLRAEDSPGFLDANCANVSANPTEVRTHRRDTPKGMGLWVAPRSFRMSRRRRGRWNALGWIRLLRAIRVPAVSPTLQVSPFTVRFVAFASHKFWGR